MEILKRLSLRLIIPIVLIIISILSFNLYNNFQNSKKSYRVSGIIISKDVEQYAHGKHQRNMSTRYVMAIKPYDLKTYKSFDIYVDYLTYCTHEKGSKITFNNLSGYKCLRNYVETPLWKELCYGFFPFSIMCFTILMTIASMIWSLVCLFNEIRYEY